MTQVSNEVHVYEDDFPRHLGPPPVPIRGGGPLLDQTKPTYLPQLDAGAFRAVWELLEAEAKHRFSTHETMSSARAYLRAVTAFRRCYWSHHESPDPSPPVRKLVRK